MSYDNMIRFCLDSGGVYHKTLDTQCICMLLLCQKSKEHVNPAERNILIYALLNPNYEISPVYSCLN